MSGDLRLTGKLNVDARKMLRRVCELFDKHDIPYVLEGGTLLGIVRENRLLPWDNDIDITTLEEYLEPVKKLEKKLWLYGYRLKLSKSREPMPHFPVGTVRLVKILKKSFIHTDTGLLDIFIKKKIDDRYHWIVGRTDHVHKSVPAHFYENRGRFSFEGYDYSVPADYEDYLSYRYGDWREPVKDYDFKKDDLCIEE